MAVGGLITLLGWLVGTTFAVNGTSSCGVNELMFMGKCWCEPGWESKSVNPLTCTDPILENDDCACEPFDSERAFLGNLSWRHAKGYRCEALCRWNSQVGMPRSLPNEWEDNQGWKQLPFYMKDLPKKNHNHLIERLHEFSKAFEHWHYLNNTNLGRVLELGAGGYTQLRNILETAANVQIEHATLVDPQIHKYEKIRGCSYQSGQLVVRGKSYPTTLINTTVEEFGRQEFVSGSTYDTVIVMNVLVYALNAFEFLETVHKSLKPGGLLLFHDRWFDNSPISSKCKTAGFFVNILQVSKSLLDHFLSYFTNDPFVSTAQTHGQKMRSEGWCRGKDNERAYFAAVRKL